MPTEIELAEALFAGLARAMREDAARKPRRRRSTPSATRYQVLDAADQATHEGCAKTRLPDGSGYLIAPRDPKDAETAPGWPLRLHVPYGSRQCRVFAVGERGKPETSRLVSNSAAIEAIRRLVAGIEDKRVWNEPPPESCQCAVVASPPCSFCENCSECETCGEFVLDLEYHADAQHSVAAPATP